jgi:hypothetical protein
MTDSNQEIKNLGFLPFHAINEFMRPNFRLKVIRETLNALPDLPGQQRSQVNRFVKKAVKIPGFRNPDKAPVVVKVLPTANAFEKQPQLVSSILSAWAEFRGGLRAQMYAILCERGWPTYPSDMLESGIENIIPKLDREWRMLPPDADRTRLPGFYPYWPKGEDFEILYEAFSQKFPEEQASIDETSLMAVWLSLRLPYEIEPGKDEPITDDTRDSGT